MVKLNRKKVRQILRQKGWPVSELARRLGTSRSGVHFTLTRAPKYQNQIGLVRRWAEALGVEGAEIMEIVE